ncbi:hypothetical protein I7I48_04288 [Histoplasma ohiense]|nr:hypothetical protein I7I48_04288 [Histoplasma ohiense (nom. inval.)]
MKKSTSTTNVEPGKTFLDFTTRVYTLFEGMCGPGLDLPTSPALAWVSNGSNIGSFIPLLPQDGFMLPLGLCREKRSREERQLNKRELAIYGDG